MNLPEKLKSFKPYPAMTGAPAVRVDGNESCFPLPPALLDEIAETVRRTDIGRYPDPYATEVCSLAEQFWGAPEGSAVAGNGSDELISIALSSLLPRGGRLLVCDPDFSMYRFYAALYELECAGTGRYPGVPEIGEVIEKGKDADAVILSNPCNPTGQGVLPDEMLRVAESLNCPVLLDEAYMDFWDGGKHSLLPYIDRYNNLMILKTCSKNLALAGIRLGFAFCGEELSGVLRSVKSPYNVNAVTQAAGAAVLRRPDWIRDNTKRLCEAKDRLFKRLGEWARETEGASVTDTVANFVLLTLPDAPEWHRRLQSRGVGVRLINGVLRITAGAETEQDALLAALDKR